MALKCGAAAVFELPVCYASGSAEYFATGAVSLLDSLGIVDCLCFGSECNDLMPSAALPTFFWTSRQNTGILLKNHLKNGQSYPAARMQAVSEYSGMLVLCFGSQ